MREETKDMGHWSPWVNVVQSEKTAFRWEKYLSYFQHLCLPLYELGEIKLKKKCTYRIVSLSQCNISLVLLIKSLCPFQIKYLMSEMIWVFTFFCLLRAYINRNRGWQFTYFFNGYLDNKACKSFHMILWDWILFSRDDETINLLLQQESTRPSGDNVQCLFTLQ